MVAILSANFVSIGVSTVNNFSPNIFRDIAPNGDVNSIAIVVISKIISHDATPMVNGTAPIVA